MKKPETKAEFAVWRANTQLGWIQDTLENRRVTNGNGVPCDAYVRHMAEKIIEDMEILKTLVDAGTLFR
jgi:hypothetical protein